METTTADEIGLGAGAGAEGVGVVGEVKVVREKRSALRFDEEVLDCRRECTE